MYVPACFSLWWLFPVLMIVFCLLMCFSMRRRGLAGCCMDGHRRRHTGGDRSIDRRKEETSTPADKRAEAEI